MKKIVALICVLLWCSFIFYNSSRNGNVSNDKSFSILNEIKSKYYVIKNHSSLGGNLNENNKSIAKTNVAVSKGVSPINRNSKRNEKINLFLRKNAHAFEYFILGFLILIILKIFGNRTVNLYIGTLFFCLLYAVLDEYHQLFVPGRTSSVTDVLIDFSGALSSMLIYIILTSIYKRHNIKAKQINGAN